MLCRAAFFPSCEKLAGNPYWFILRSSLEELGVEFNPSVAPEFSRRGLWKSRHRVDVLHFHYVQQFYAYESTEARLRWVLRFARNMWLARAFGYRTVFTLHDLSPTWPLHPGWVDRWGHWVAANLSDSVIVHCDFARRALAERFGRRKNVYLVCHPHFIGVYPNQISPEEAKARLGFSEEQTVFTFFGGIRPNKGIERLLESFRRLPGRDLRLLVAGKPWFPPEYVAGLEETAHRDDRIRIVAEFVPADQIQIYLKASDVVVLPFSSILTSSSAVLAMSFGRPLVVPAIGCLPELVTEGVGLVYDPGDDDSLLYALQQCSKLDLRSMGARALDRVRAFSWQGMAEQTLAAYGSEELRRQQGV